jgi:hypothetical protein
MFDALEQGISLHEHALHQALKETLAQQRYPGVVPVAPDYQTVARRAHEIEQAWQRQNTAELGMSHHR